MDGAYVSHGWYITIVSNFCQPSFFEKCRTQNAKCRINIARRAVIKLLEQETEATEEVWDCPRPGDGRRLKAKG
jgi:hypothetical protein